MNYQEFMEHRNSINRFARHVHCRLTEVREGYAKAQTLIDEDSVNPVGSVHGGCIYTTADVACGAAAASYGQPVTTVDSSFSFMRAGLGIRSMTGEAEVIKRGKKLLFVRASIRDDKGTELAEGMFTFMTLDT